ncbi:coiled-coil domain-containing protein 158-like [Colossoma macropomum]|uniref:coiled-coil domain-containing protein 158-like n=1 Tax=Colossoma macropomum TaxID=42526 RepID=UPI00186475DF|nr:coiled-coil domain-containing protein 158-like [Colossoma macropomum]
MSSDHLNDASESEKPLCSSDECSDNAAAFVREEPTQPNSLLFTLSLSCWEESMPEKHSFSLDMLSEELERQTKQTQKLQEEVEQATRLTWERMGHAFNNTETPVNCSSTKSGTSETSPEHGLSTQQCVLRPVINNVDVNIARCLNFPGKDVLEQAIEEYSQQVSDLQRQLRETYELHEQQKFHFRQSIIQLQTKLHESQIEKDALIDLRMEESRKQSELMEQLQGALQELDSLKQTGEQKLMEAEDKAKAFSKRAETMEEMLQDMFLRLSHYEKRSGKGNYLLCDGTFSPSKLLLGPAVEKALQDLENENCGLQEQLQLMERQLEDLEKKDQGRTECLLHEQKKKMKQLITSHDQEMAVLTEKLSSSESNAANLQLQVELLQEQVESQTSQHKSQISNLKSSLSMLHSELLEKQQTYEAKVSALEESLTQAHSREDQAQRERDLSLQQAEELDAQLCRLMKELRQTAEELSVERKQMQQLWERDTGLGLTVQSLRHELEQRSLGIHQLESLVHSLKEQCQKYEDTQEQSSQEAKRLQAALDMQERELSLQQQEAQETRVQLEEAQGRVQTLWAEMEVLRMKLQEGENSTDLMRKPLEALQEERRGLDKQLEQLRLDNQQLKSALQEAEVRLSAVEKDKIQQQAALSERTHSLHQLTLEKQQVTAELEEQRVKLGKLKEEQEALREQHSRTTKELQEQNSKLRSQLNNTQASLELAKSTLRTLEGADGHGLKVALGMQKQITAKREQIDFLQSRVQMLEETTEKLAQEKRYQAMESKRRMQELRFEMESRRRLETELDTLRTNEKLLKSKAERLDIALHKMSDSFAECQEYIQKQEQEIMRLKLQHALEVKELQGQNLRATGNIHRSPITSPTVPEHLPTLQTNSSSQRELNTGSQRPSPTLERRSLVKELHSVINDEQGPRAKTRSEETHRIRNEQGLLRTSDLEKQDVNSAFSANNEDPGLRAAQPCYRSVSCVAALGRKSPVHSLLTSDLPIDLYESLKEESPTSAAHISAKNPDELTAQTCKELQSKLSNLQNHVEDLQKKNQEMASMIKTQEKRVRRVKDRKEPLKR